MPKPIVQAVQRLNQTDIASYLEKLNKQATFQAMLGLYRSCLDIQASVPAKEKFNHSR